MIGLTLASWRQHRRRYLATFLAIFLGVGFCASALSLTAAAKRGAEDAVAVQFSKADVVATPLTPPQPALVQRLRELPDVADVAVVQTAQVDVAWPDGHAPGYAQVSDIAAPVGLRWQQLTSGVFPSGLDQVVVAANVASSEGLGLGSPLTLHLGAPGPRVVTVVGLVKAEKGADGVSTIFTAPGALTSWQVKDLQTQVLVTGAGGVAQARLAEEIGLAAPSFQVATSDTMRQQALSSLSNGVDVLGRAFQGFAVVALFVAGLVIANTFRIVMTQRVRDLALLRCIGAERWQIFAMTVGESLLLGVLAAAAGTTTGIACGALLVEVLNRTSVPVSLTFVLPGLATVLLPFGGGVVVALAAVLSPAARASRVAPLAALRPGSSTAVRSRAGALQLGAGVLLSFVGCMLLGLAVVSGRLVPGIAGGLVSFAGVLALTPVIVPTAIRLAGAARRLLPRRWRGGVPAELSVLNAVRNPRRTAATSAALLVGVTLISMMSVGAASVSATESSALDRVTPVDVTVSGGEVPAGLVGRAGQVEGVQQVVVALGEAAHTSRGATQVASLTEPAAAAVVRDQALRSQLANSSTVVVPVSAQQDVPGDGSMPFTLRVGRAGVRVRPVFSSLTSGPMLVSPSVLARLGGRQHTVALYIKVSAGADPQTVVSGLRDAIGTVGPAAALTVDGGYVKRSTYDRAISVMLLVATALLAMAVLIALVGVGNTLSLSVLERTREHGLLRALGLSTGQLRMLLANEAVLMSGAAALFGTALGVGYGWAGTLTLLHGTTNHAPTLALPVARLALVGCVAVGAGLLASVLPARQAVRLSPVAALNED